MKISDIEFANFLDAIIEEKVNKRISIELAKRNLVTAWIAKVTNIALDGTIDVKLATDDVTVLTGKKNKTGETLNENDEVYLYSPHGKLSTSYVAIKK